MSTSDQRDLVADGHETSWYRDPAVYVSLATAIIPALLESRAGTRHLTAWSAACSTGQEAYSLAMSLSERLPQGWTAEVWATDISQSKVDRVRAGHYSQVEMNRGLPAASLVRHFTRIGAEWEVDAALRAMVHADRIDLTLELPPLPVFDLVFARNVLSLLDDETTKQVADRLHAAVAPDGFLVVGASETSRDLGAGWVVEQRGRISVHRPRSGSTGVTATRRRLQELNDAYPFLTTGA